MTSRIPPPRRDPMWLPYLGAAAMAAGVIYGYGQLGAGVQRNRDDIVALKAADQARSEALQTLLIRTVRIEAKIDMLTNRNDRVDKADDRRDMP